jgi:hypothetical protein
MGRKDTTIFVLCNFDLDDAIASIKDQYTHFMPPLTVYNCLHILFTIEYKFLKFFRGRGMS